MGGYSLTFFPSFAEYFDEDHISDGALRVFNHDVIAGENGFPPHSHKEMEIVTVMLKRVSHT